MIAVGARRHARHARRVHNDAMMHARASNITGMVSAFLFALSGLAVQAQADDGDYIRQTQADDGAPEALEVAVASFENAAGARIDLVSAVHVADRSYFEAIDRRLAEYEVVLYELVGEPGASPTSSAARPSMVGLLQGGMKNALGLAFQLDEIDYRRDNMVHADLTPDAFSASMRDRGESVMGMMIRGWALAMAEQGAGNGAGQEADFIKVLFADDRQLALKRLLAAQLSEQADLLESLAGDDGSTLITVRNQRALEVLADQLSAGARDVAIFYGAGHMPDFEARLVEEFGMRKVSTEWLEAWDLR